MAEEDDNPLIKALPPATDYLTYLTLLEYQLTPARLPTLHRLLQDENLTTNIGWDLVQLLLPLLPQSQECLQDVARLGNPREVILRVSDALMQLQPINEDEDEDEAHDVGDLNARIPLSSTGGIETKMGNATVDGECLFKDETSHLPRHILQFNSLVAMLSVLHSRIQTRSPSRFLATSLQAALEAYTSMPTNETTIALLEFFRDVSPSKRPAPPPRVASEPRVLRVAEASAPDPEAETQSPNPGQHNEKMLVRRFLQFGLIELLKSYLLSFSDPTDPGMSWTIRLQEKFHPETCLPGRSSKTAVYTNDTHLKERDMIMAKIIALSRDFCLDDNQLHGIVSQTAESLPPPLDFDEPPRQVHEIPLERHGALLLLAARAAMSELFSSGQSTPMPIFPDLARVFSNFVGGYNMPEDVAFGQPEVLLDSLLTLTVVSMQRPIGLPATSKEFREFVLSLAACTTRQNYNTVRRIPGAIVHSHSSHLDRFKLIRYILEEQQFQAVKGDAIGWLKQEILAAAAHPNESNLFLSPHYFSVLFPLLFNSPTLLMDVSDIVASWIKFSQMLAPSIHAAVNLYYILVSSPHLRVQLQLEKMYIPFRDQFVKPLRSILRAFEGDLTRMGGDGHIEAGVGQDICEMGMARSVGMVSHALEQVENVVSEVFVGADTEFPQPSADDIARVDRIRKDTET
ncbi:hypothetical protein EYZ11_000521 [Aspergillus tanneri]|uniref:YAP-binding/ALF4/Glomulin n=1 Tax=Aspergillus tanneri TaxID=1220188 RepID=A0A4S3JWT0_9EURO|nr:uncharacterized protein ATNIH1004_004074 [Aspergillus tanneri]KAA8648191.1 hypothetical protein ATNIH1004_004074 [Aspergillus tanneri]THC99942.1 hypothetical protein EYZ11_000521 [Aspergillus tanneri]